MNRLVRTFSSLSAWVLQPLLVLVILVLGFAAASQLSLRREPPQRSQAVAYAPLVRAIVARTGEHAVDIRGHGSLEARSRIDLVPQVGGQVVAIHPQLRDGGRFAAGEVLLRIESRDYELAISRAEANVASAETRVVTVSAESEAARSEWEQLHPGEPCPALVSLEPQKREAHSRVLTAQVEHDKALLDLERTQLRLPFDGRVVRAEVDVGEVVAPNQRVGEVYATEVFEVAVPLRVEELVWLDLPHNGDTAAGSAVVVRGRGPGGSFEVPARIARVSGELDATSRLARVVVEIPTAELDTSVASDLLPGTFVDVEFEGAVIEGVAELPRGALREGARVWVVRDGRLSFVTPRIRFMGNGSALVEGLQADAHVVISNLEVVTDGMQVRLEEAPR